MQAVKPLRHSWSDEPARFSGQSECSYGLRSERTIRSSYRLASATAARVTNISRFCQNRLYSSSLSCLYARVACDSSTLNLEDPGLVMLRIFGTVRAADRGRGVGPRHGCPKASEPSADHLLARGHSGRRPRFCGGMDSELLQKGSDRGQRLLVTIVGGVAQFVRGSVEYARWVRICGNLGPPHRLETSADAPAG